ncbi:alpha-1,3-mannosyltransferase [Cordyceps fumosorosea ARSEF 2679]|uniref:Alpha-1,3-mannosyltransferase n=1 Tax=Cordyceps fumosorosea (strain ARSEF 2679) TaxID=1081104 RepID=A0A168DCV6_CORFA|nr:alpha-1,3-mannosyltransferase [Cordyceps fumosorosea ARSEF 2679]OAA72450.1 alpha-1,3-mannosyltransferase [Cordyceps fumosorosea ARSEF 2679]
MRELFELTWAQVFRYLSFAALLALIKFISTCIYNVTLHPLARIPGSRLAAMTSLYEFWFDVVCDGTYIWEIKRMHAKYGKLSLHYCSGEPILTRPGPIIRVNPREIHIKDSEYYSTIYTGSARRVDKDPAAVGALALRTAAAATIDHDLHHARRGYLKPYFSKRAIACMEHAIYSHIDKLCQRAASFMENDAVMALDPAFAALTADIITERLYGETLQYLDIPDFRTPIAEGFLGIDLMYHFTRFFPGVVKLFKKMPTAIVRRISPAVAELLALQEGIKQNILQTLKTQEGRDSDCIIVSAAGDSEIPAAERQIDRLMDEGASLTIAGTETTARALSVGMFHLLSDKRHLLKLHEELRSLPSPPNREYPFAQLEPLPYLTGVVYESCRLSFGPINRSPRVATHESLQYGVYTIPPGTPVSQSTYFVHTDESVFPDPLSFDPDRWTRAARDGIPLNRYLANFSKGSRQCIGIQLAFTELYLTIARLVTSFEMDLHETTKEDVAIHHVRLVGYPKKRKGMGSIRGEVKVRIKNRLESSPFMTPILRSFRRLSPSREFGKLGRQRRAVRCVKLLLISLFAGCLIFFYIDNANQITDASDFSRFTPSVEEPVTPTPGGHADHEIASVGLQEPPHSQQQTEKIRNTDFEHALRRVDSLLPSETEARDLLHDIQGTGEEKLREIGLRAREYSQFFQAWEQLHLVEDTAKSTFIRADMVPYMRRYFSTGVDKMPAAEVEQTIRTYEKYKTFMYKFEKLIAGWTAPYFADHMTLHLNLKQGGRGIVVTAGNTQAPHLKTLVHSLRDVGCNLPIEVMYLDNDDLGVDVQEELAGLDGVVTREIAPMVDDKGWKLAGWAVKPFAILFSSFREVIFVDADSLFFHDPETLFEDEDYQRTGALFFRDRTLWKEWKQDWLKKVLPKPISPAVIASRYWKGESGHMQESGVVVVDKWRHFIAMLIVCRMNGPERDGNKEKDLVGVYDMVYGDKETFWIGWELVGDTDYAFHRGRVAVMGVAEDGEEARKASDKDKPDADELKRSSGPTAETNNRAPAAYTVCAPQLLHLGVDGSPLWFNGGLVQNKFLDKKEWEFGKFREFVVEPDTVLTSTWTMLGGNKACLTGDAGLKHSLSENEGMKLQKMIAHARKYVLGQAR